MVKNKHNLKVDKEEIIKQLCKAICPIIQPYTCQYLCTNIGNCQELIEKVTKIYDIFCLGDIDMKKLNDGKYVNYDNPFVNKVNNTIASNKIDMKDADLTKINSNLATEATFKFDGVDTWGPYLGKCPYCGSANIEADYSTVLTTMPPQYNCRCKDCKGTFFSGQIKQENQTITPYNPDPGLPNYPDQPQKPNYGYGGDYGWICPKCGKVNAPHINFCDCSSGKGWDVVWCNSEGTSAGKPNTMPNVSISGVNSTTVNNSNTATSTYSFEACNLHEKPNPPRIKPVMFTENFSLKEEKDYENKFLGDLN